MSEDCCPPPNCLDCGLPYEQFGIDTTLPNSQWLKIHPDNGGLLCASCMVKRAAKIPGIIAARMVLEIAPQKISTKEPTDVEYAAEMAAWDAVSEEALRNCEEWTSQNITSAKDHVPPTQGDLSP